MIGQNKDYVSVYLSEDVIKIAQIEVSGASRKLINVLKRDLHGIPEADLPKIIHSLVSSINAQRARAIVIVPSNQITTKNIEIPSRDPAEIKSIINLQAGRHTPYSRDEILISYVNIGVYQTNYTKVLLVIMNRNVVKKQLGLLEKAGLKIEKVLFAPEGIARFYSRGLELEKEDIPVGIIDVGNQLTDFVVEFHGTVIANRSIPIGLKHLMSQGQEARDKLIEEIAKSIESYQNEDIDKVPASYILTNDDAHIKELQPLLKEKLNANIKIVPYLDQMDAAQTALLKVISEYSGNSFVDIIAPATVCDESQVDLMPEEMKLQRNIEEQSREILKSGIFAVLILILIFAIFFNKLYFKTAFKDKLTEDYSQKRQEAEVLQNLATKTRIVKDYLNSRMVPLDILGELYKVLPEGIYLEVVDLNDKGAIVIKGTSESMSLVFALQTSLEASALFKKVETKSTSAKKERGKDLAAFEIDFKLKSAKDEKETDSKDATDNDKTDAEGDKSDKESSSKDAG